MTGQSTLLRKLFAPTPSDRYILELDINRGVVTAPPDNPFQALALINSPTLRALREGLRAAAKDDNVAGLLVHIGTNTLPLPVVDEVGDLISRFAQSKPTIAWSETYGELTSAVGSYLLATSCDEIWLQPSGQVAISGLHSSITLLRPMLEKLGIDPEFAQRYEYKTAADQFSADHVSEANREMSQALLDSLMERFVLTVAERRNSTPDQVWELVDRAMLTPEEALQAGLIDKIGYRDEVYQHAFSTWGGTREHLRYVHRYHSLHERASSVKLAMDRGSQKIAVVGLRGNIVTGRGRSGSGASGAADVVTDQLRLACRDDKVRAVVLRIDSPGGSAIASDSIWRAVHQVRESGRIVVASMGNVAASGGYYSAMAANEIVALPSTLTGSIGVLGGKFVTRRMFEKIGIIREGVSAGENAGMLSGESPLTPEQWEMFNTWMDQVYTEFTEKAAADRGMALEDLQRVARGRVWTGRDAAGRGLVDHLGGMHTAIERACGLAGLDPQRVKLKPIPTIGLLDRLRPAESSESPGAAVTMSSIPTSFDDMLAAAAQRAGLNIPGVLTLPVSYSLS